MFYRTLIAFACFYAVGSSADVYRWVDETGRTQFSDRPHAGSQVVESAEPAGTDLRGPQAAEASAQGPTGALLGSYESFEILAPEQEQVLRVEPRDIPLGLLIKPQLQDQHRLVLDVDGTTMDVDKSLGTQIKLNGVTLGTHVVVARVLDAEGETVAQTPPVTFHLRKPLPAELSSPE